MGNDQSDLQRARPTVVASTANTGDTSLLLRDAEFDSSAIVRHVVPLPQGYERNLAFVLDNVLTKRECEELIAFSEAGGYVPAMLNVGRGYEIMATDVRNNSRYMLDDVPLAERIWQRIKDHVPAEWKERDALGLNERLRFLRYDPGEKFKSHCDGAYFRDNGERSFLTLQLYLNEGFEGGSTAFLSRTPKCGRFDYVPKTGSALIFQHDTLHKGSRVKAGRKYTIRTDIMFSAPRGSAGELPAEAPNVL